MPYPRVVPHSDGAGVIDAVGLGVPAARVGQAVWCYGAQSYRAFGTAAEPVVVPAALAVPLPDGAGSQPEVLEQAACLGIAGITGYRAVFAGGPVAGLDVLVWGAASGVGAVALQMAHRAGARVLAVVRRAEQLPSVRALGAAEAWLADDPALVEQIRLAAPAGVHRIAEVDFAAPSTRGGQRWRELRHRRTSANSARATTVPTPSTPIESSPPSSVRPRPVLVLVACPGQPVFATAVSDSKGGLNFLL